MIFARPARTRHVIGYLTSAYIWGNHAHSLHHNLERAFAASDRDICLKFPVDFSLLLHDDAEIESFQEPVSRRARPSGGIDKCLVASGETVEKLA